jgi:hypothetical protein
LTNIEIPAALTIIDETSFEGCTELESCMIAKDSSLVTIGANAFAQCTSLRLFSIPRQVREIGSNSFNGCIHLSRVRFSSSASLKRIVGHRSLDATLNKLAASGSSHLFRIEVDDGGMELNLPG